MTARPSLRDPAVLLATWFGAGYLRPAPGTWGTAAALPVGWFLMTYAGAMALLAAGVATFLVGIWAANGFDRLSGGHDSSEIVIDEAAGLFLTLGLIGLFLPLNPVALGFGFLLFRLFDILKPFPIRQADASIPGGVGVMIDDALAAIYAAAVYCIGARLIEGWAS